MKSKWSVLAVYENSKARDLAVQFCDLLVQRFWSQCGFDLAWCNWTELEDPMSAKEAGKRATEADWIIVAPNPSTIIPVAVKGWLERALKARGEREGVLVGLPGSQADLSAGTAATQGYLRKLAHAAGMDYLDAVPESLSTSVPESTDAYTQRATQVTSVLDNILRYSPQPPPAP